MPNAARLGDMHTCPLSDGPKPHVGGPIITGSPNVFIGGMPAARVGDTCTCVGPPDTIVKGSTGVFINSLPAARLGDLTAHGGVITVGCPTVIIGETSPGGIGGVQAGMGTLAGQGTSGSHEKQRASKSTAPINLNYIPTKSKQRLFRSAYCGIIDRSINFNKGYVNKLISPKNIRKYLLKKAGIAFYRGAKGAYNAAKHGANSISAFETGAWRSVKPKKPTLKSAGSAAILNAVIEGGIASYNNYDKYKNKEISGANYTGRIIYGTAKGAVSGLTGAYAGAAIGTLLGGPVGTIVGFAVGYLASTLVSYTIDHFIGEEKAGQWADSAAKKSQELSKSADKKIKATLNWLKER